MTITIQLNGVKVKRDIPTSWPEVTFRKFLDLESCGDDMIKVIALFTEVPTETLMKSKVFNLDLILKSLAFIRVPDFVTTPPQSILGYPIPKNLDFQSMAQYADFKLELDKQLTPIERLKQYPLYCAIYACDPYDVEKAKSLEPKFWDAPCTEVMAIGNFTLAKLAGLNLPTGKGSPTASTLLKKLRLALRALLARLDFTVRFYSWKRKQDTSVTKS